MNRRVLIDTGPLVAILSDRDQHHGRCVAIAKTLPDRLFTNAPVLTEAAHIISRYGGLSPRTILDLVRRHQLIVLPLDREDYLAIDSILDRYNDQGLSLADASLMHLAEREQIDEVFTVDYEDFAAFRTTSGKSLKIVE